MRRFIIVGIVVVMVVAAGVAVAQVGDDGVLYACASNKDGALRLISSSESCDKKETPVSWNAEGPQGLAGIDGTDGVDGADAQVGEIVMTSSGNAWLAHGENASVTPFERWGTETTFFAPVRAVVSLTGPGAIGGVEYGLASFDLCVITGSNYVSAVYVTGIASFDDTVDDDQYLNAFEGFVPDPGLTTGCHTFDVGSPAGQGAGLMIEVTDIADGSPVTLSSVKSVWAPEAAQN